MSHNLFKKVESKQPVKASAERAHEQNIDNFNKVLHSMKTSPHRYSINAKMQASGQVGMTEKTQASHKGSKPSQMYSSSALSHSMAGSQEHSNPHVKSFKLEPSTSPSKQMHQITNQEK